MTAVLPSTRGPSSPPRAYSAGGSLRFLARNRFQILGALLLAVLLPNLLGPPFFQSEFQFLGRAFMRPDSTVFGTALAVLVGHLILKRITIYPGARGPAYVFPVFTVAYAAVIVVFFFARFDYSRFQFLLSFILAVGWYLVVFRVERRLIRPNYLLLPFGAAGQMMRLGGAEWRVAQTPREIPNGVTAVVADLRADLSDDWERMLANAALRGLPVYHFKQLSESLTGRVEIEHLSENNLGSLLPSSLYLRFQRVGDILLAILTLPVTMPILLLGILSVKLCDRGPVFFTQERMGYRGKVFRIVKLRTMCVNAAASGAFTKDGDPRVTSVGRFLRKMRVDELPQIWNILRGDMSWIGPRPEALELSQWYERQIPFYRYRHIVRPGITGWGAVNQGNVAEVAEATTKLQYDFYYIKNFGLWLDLLIMAKTIRTVLTGFGSK
ncbi:MAG: sugar transferase [Bauldia sp.]